MKCVYLFSFLVLVATKIEAAPADSQNLLGVNIGGLHANLKTNLFSNDGPLAQLGNEIASGAKQLDSELASGAKALETDLKNTKNFLSQGSQEEIAGVNIGGIHAGIKTNLFSSGGPLAQIENDLAAGEQQLQNDMAKGANALKASLSGAADAFQSELSGSANLLTSGLQNLGSKISWPTGGASLDALFNGGNSIFSSNNIATSSNEGKAMKLNPLELTETISGNIPDMKPQKISKTTIMVTSGQPGQTSKQTVKGEIKGEASGTANAVGGLLSFLQGGTNGQAGLKSEQTLEGGASGSGNALLSLLQGGSSGQPGGTNSVTKTISINGQVSGASNPVDLSKLFQNLQLPNMCGNAKGV